MGTKKVDYAPGMRLLIRDEEWLARRVDKISDGKYALTVSGLSSITRGQTRVFLTSLEEKIEVVDPLNVRFARDNSRKYRNSRLFIEQLLRQTTPTDSDVHIGDKAAIDPIPYQFDPAIQALNQPRPRILIADAVGLGKTIECGILLAELIKRGRGKRILVLAVKSMLTQFQKELWARFTIPLVRLDSVGIQRVRNRIPTNQNPFYYYDKTIVSIDTLKREQEYRNYLEKSHWDVIVIDEAHNVADRSGSQRSKLAKLISKRSDALIMLSATPHDGRKSSFASLMTALEPTAIVDPDNYGPNDIKGLFVRRFKKDVKDQIREAFPERVVCQENSRASSAEEAAFDCLTDLKFKRIDQNRKSGDFLFRTTLEKALFSSPVACRETIRNRARRLEKEASPEAKVDAERLRELDALLAEITPESFAKYRRLLEMLRPNVGTLKWNPKNSNDRVVIFTERVETTKFLKERLAKDLKLPDDSIAILRGDLGDAEIMRIVEDFGVETSKTRLLICTDVASEGINLHYLCHRLIHFDVPWSLTIFQQRNGRVDRYGQKERPEIYYLSSQSANPKIRGDQRILERLVEKDKQVVESIGDPSEFSGLYDAKSEELQTGEAFENGTTAEEFDARANARLQAAAEDDPLAALFAGIEQPVQTTFRSATQEPTLFASDFEYARQALDFVNAIAAEREKGRGEGERLEEAIYFKASPEDETIELTPNEPMRARFDYLPPEIVPESGRFRLCARVDEIKKEFDRRRRMENSWPEIQYLWGLHPVLEYLNDLTATSFGRMRAPTVVLASRLKPGETLYVASALVPNRQSQPVVFKWYGALCRNGALAELKPFEYWIEKLRLAEDDWFNPDADADPNEFAQVDAELDKKLRAPLKEVVGRVRDEIVREATEWKRRSDKAVIEQLNDLNKLKERRLAAVQEKFDFTKDFRRNRAEEKFERDKREIEAIFADFRRWVDDAAEIEKDAPSIRIVAAMRGDR